MLRNFVLTLTGADRIGIVDELTALLLERGGNVETSRMARLGGEFAVLMLVAMPAEGVDTLDAALARLVDRGYKVTATPTSPGPDAGRPGWSVHRLEVHGADHEGIIQRVAHHLSQHGITIEALDTETTAAPHSGAPLFAMTAVVAAPPGLDRPAWEAGLEEIGHRMNLEIRVLDADGR